MDQLVAILLSLILSVTGISRTVDPILVQDAQRRVVEIQSDWSHNGMAYNEVLHYSQGAADPVGFAVDAWRNSPGHWAIMSNPALTRIGCAVDVDATQTYWFACSFAPSVVQSVPTPVEQPPVETPPIVLPDTAMENDL